jgi:hypothetical protein
VGAKCSLYYIGNTAEEVRFMVRTILCGCSDTAFFKIRSFTFRSLHASADGSSLLSRSTNFVRVSEGDW